MFPPDPEEPICSAKGCRSLAVWVLAWNNPKIHPPERRKTWLACDEHREHLSGFLDMRGFLKDVVPLADWTGPGTADSRDQELRPTPRPAPPGSRGPPPRGARSAADG